MVKLVISVKKAGMGYAIKHLSHGWLLKPVEAGWQARYEALSGT